MSWLRRAWAWVVAGLGSAVVLFAYLWRRAVLERNAARAERDAARRSAERERQVASDSEVVRDAMRGRRVEIEAEHKARVEEIEARPKPTSRDDLVAELNRRLEERRRKHGR